jgi:hypothetical protein
MDRIAVLETLNVIAHDYGLYAVKTRLDRMGFRAGLRDSYDRLNDDQQWLYTRLERRAVKTLPTDTRLARA